ncbi:mevalonate kinase family protein [Ulvibacter antarcticus]|uniref:Galactokinase n=1 Tax=Ulvibacter antarcticus TaxID=442714 RepID=A0A3L9YBK7_9FLAO|nr:galactokinase family protein [Ulvibacter antarcticus]RMA58056.1 galactokinase [Ulvibacter antarcticus]
MNRIEIRTPARICLFGDHQDYLGLPVIACAIDRFVFLKAEKNNDKIFSISMPDISSERHISLDNTFEQLESLDFFGAALRVVKRHGCFPSEGYTVSIQGNIPINAGVSSSSAIVVAWIHFLLKAFGCNKPVTSQLIAQLAYEAEIVEHDAPGGRMDQYAIAIGNVLYIDTSTNSGFNTIGTTLNGLILAESGVPKQTLTTLKDLRSKAVLSIEYVQKKDPKFEIKNSKLSEFEVLKKYIPEDLQAYFYAAIANHEITQKALKLFKSDIINFKLIGKLMNEHHTILKDVLKITVPTIDTMITTALQHEAYGAKIVGSGDGGSIVVLSPPNKEKIIIDALLKNGAKAAYKVSVTQGSKEINA